MEEYNAKAALLRAVHLEEQGLIRVLVGEELIIRNGFLEGLKAGFLRLYRLECCHTGISLSLVELPRNYSSGFPSLYKHCCLPYLERFRDLGIVGDEIPEESSGS